MSILKKDLYFKKMSKSFFRFKAFGIHQDRCAMKVSTDGVLLGALAGHAHASTMLEIGVGTGVVSLMMAQRFTALQILGIEIDPEALAQAQQNAFNSPWKNRIEFRKISFQDFAQQVSLKFDLVVSNPPYFPNHLKSPNEKRNLALHQDALTFEELVNGAVKVLAPLGQFWLILPPHEMKVVSLLASKKRLYLNQLFNVRDKASKPILRQIGQFSFQEGGRPNFDLIIKDKAGDYSPQYQALLREFLIIF